MFDNEFPPLGGGTGVVNYHLLKEMTKCPDVTVDLVTSSRSRCRYEEERFSDRIMLHKVPVDNRNIHHSTNRELVRYSARGLRYAYRLAQRHRYDVSVAFAGVPAGALSYALNLTHRLPYVLSLQGPDVPGFERRYEYLYPFLKPFIRHIWRRAGAVTAISAEQAVLARRTMPGLRLVTIPNGVDTETFRPGDRRTSEELNVVCAARLIERKGQHHLLEALAQLRGSCRRPVRVTLVGTGDAEPALRDLAVRLRIAEHVTFMGYVPREQMPQVYHAADIFALPSQQEGMSIALLEAMASGLPVIVTPTGGTDELVTKAANGDIVPWADVAALAAALKRMAEDAEARARMGAESRRRAIRFGWPALADRYLDLCASVVTGTTAQEGQSGAFAARCIGEGGSKEFRT
ncbi:MAG TPA: glycosyltransferase family 4 protein [Nitrospiraceae bacterium]|nr:glycosyltransferase family 4 protein [Nitrospiraceae bacterium]